MMIVRGDSENWASEAYLANLIFGDVQSVSYNSFLLSHYNRYCGQICIIYFL